MATFGCPHILGVAIGNLPRVETWVQSVLICLAMAKPKTRLPLRLFNVAGRVGRRFGIGTGSFVECGDEILEQAARAAGCDDFGDPAFLEGYRVLLEAYDREARLSPFGAMSARAQLGAILRNRLRAQQAWSGDPSILERPIERPIFILGLPRAGTTAMHHLLGADPQNQVLEYWLAAVPKPRPPRSQWSTDPSFIQAETDLSRMYWLDPGLKAIHLMTADGPEECRHLLQQTLADDTFDCNATIPSYSEWYASCDMQPVYEQHKRLLQLIGSNDPDRCWLLKYPVHMGNLRTVLSVYPDARFVQTHRDPTKVIPSICSLVAGWRALSQENFDPHELGTWQLDLWSRRLLAGIEVRRDYDDGRFFDLHFRDVQSDPIGAVRRMYDHFGLEMSDEGERLMSAWRADNPPGKYGSHKYTAADYGLTETRMNDAFDSYLDHFKIERECV